MQSNKDSSGGKSHPTRKGGGGNGAAAAKGGKQDKPGSPTGSRNKGEKKTTL